MRGEKGGLGVILLHLWRITPACAGKSIVFRIEAGNVEDHPRMRGEKVLLRVIEGAPAGSPPHARGKDL